MANTPRIKFMMDDHGPAGARAKVEVQLGRPLEDGEAPVPSAQTDHMGVHRQRQPQLSYVELRCEAPFDVAAVRMSERRTAGMDPSDADAGIAQHMARRFAPWPTARPQDTTRPPSETRSQLRDLV